MRPLLPAFLVAAAALSGAGLQGPGAASTVPASDPALTLSEAVDRALANNFGVAVDRLFCGESMFSHADNASKVGFATLVGKLRDWGFVLIDCQMPTQHLHSFGARAIPRASFADHLKQHLDLPSTADWLV